MKLPHKTLERKLFAKGYRQVLAVDEVGMGSLAGPVVVCAVMFDKKFFRKKRPKLHWLRDSKLLSPKKREEFARELLRVPSFKFRICYSYPKTIDRLNIYRAARLAMKRAVEKIQKKKVGQPSSLSFYHDRGKMIVTKNKAKSWVKSVVLIDGPHKIDGLDVDQIPIIKGDRKVFAIACASIIAKVHRDKMMVRYAKRFPMYGFEKHKGYGTKYHRAQLTALGPSNIHRRSFKPIARLSLT